MSILGVLLNIFAGTLLADHYKTDRLKGILAAVIVGWFNVWIFLHLTVRKGWTTGKAIVAIVIGWMLLVWIIFSLFFTAAVLGQVVKL